eukprot:GILK01009812.1.p1 GENE.GILK01009812.1~~GILK01009812.1.p1  ORF type:complete len:220 (+),score=8.38 GILK01009812.1:1002-1661(+)
MSPLPINNASKPYNDLCDMTYTVRSLDNGIFKVVYVHELSTCAIPFCAGCSRIDAVSNCSVATPPDKYKASTIFRPAPVSYYTYSDKVVYCSVLIPLLLPFWLAFFFIFRRWSRANKISLRSEIWSSGGALISTFATLWCGFRKFFATWFLCVVETISIDNAPPKPSVELTSIAAATPPPPPPYPLQTQAPQAMVVVLNGVPTLVYVMPNQQQQFASRV